MKKSYLAAALVAAFVGSAQAESFLYSFEVNNSTVAGSFDGTANFDLVTNLTNITAAIDGIAFIGYLYNVHYEGYAATPFSGGAVASFSGIGNNFLFIDVDFPQVGNFTQYVDFTSVQGSPTPNFASAHNALTGTHTAEWPLAGNGNWSLTAVSAVPEPETYATMLAGLGLLGAIAHRRKAKQIG